MKSHRDELEWMSDSVYKTFSLHFMHEDEDVINNTIKIWLQYMVSQNVLTVLS